MTAAIGFPMPKSIVVDDASATENYAKFIAAPFQSGFGHTLGNSLRRVLLSSLEGAAICSVRIDGAKHEFDSLDNVVEDITEIVLNLKCVRLNLHADGPKTLEIRKDKAGKVTDAVSPEFKSPGSRVALMSADPFDAAATLISRSAHLPYFIVRILWDGLTIALGIIAGGRVTAGTVIIALTLGPVVSFIGRMLSGHLTD